MTPAERPATRRGAQPPRLVRLLRGIVWRVPLGWQLSGLYTLLLALTLALVGIAVYKQQEGFLVDDAAARLEQTGIRVVARQPFAGPQDAHPGDRGGPGQGLVPGDGRSSGASDTSTALANLVRGLSGPDVTVTVRDLQGTVLTSTQELPGAGTPVVEPVSEQQATTAASGPAIHWVGARADGSRQVVVLMRISAPLPAQAGGAQGVPRTLLLEQSASLAAADAALAQLGTYLLLGILAGTLAGVLLGMVFTRAVLRPLDRVADTADAIAGGDLHRRLRLPSGRNEVARLGHAFDTMVGRLVAILEAQRRFVADASHELRTPLTSLIGLAEILMMGAHGDDSRVVEQSAGAIHDELHRLNRLVNDLLTLSRLDSTAGATTPPARRTRMDLCPTLQAAADQMSALAEVRGVRLAQSCAGPLWLLGDAGQLKQVLLNLLDNALRYTPAGGEVRVRGAVEGAMARVEVQDSGAGIAAEDLPHIFDRFYRGDASRSRATGNTGLGLAIVRAIVEAHSGRIDVASAPGAGTCFTIHLPLTPAESKSGLPGPGDRSVPAA